MNIDITWTITAVIAVSSFLSPIAVAIINNKHQAKVRRLELEHDERIMELELQQQSVVKQFDIYYVDKRESFSDFVKQAGQFSMSKQSVKHYELLHSAIDTCLLFCNSSNQQRLCEFQQYIDNQVFGATYTIVERTSYSQKLNEISLALNQELESTKPIIQRETCKS